MRCYIVTKDSETTETYFLYDGGSVIMESDGSRVTAKNTYGGPLLLRTVLGEEETTYQYLYNAHGDVVTLLTDGAVVATYYYDAFGKVLEQTGDVDNSILYAGYQYDVETGLYYLNARMYDPVTARFLQVDTYLGNLNDPLSLNLYTYCLNNPNRYIDPSGHIPALLVFLAGRLLVGAIAGVVAAGFEIINQKFIEKRTRINYNLVWNEAIVNGTIAALTNGVAAWGGFIAKQTGTTIARTGGRKIIRNVALGGVFGFAEGAISNIGRQHIIGTHKEDIDYGQVRKAGIVGSVFGIGGEFAEYGLQALKYTRMISNLRNGTKGKIGYYANVMKGNFDDVAEKTSKAVELEDVAYQSGRKTKWWHEGYVDDLSDTQVLLGVKQSDKGLSTLGSSTRENAMLAGKAWVGDNYNVIKDGAGNVLGYSSADGMRAYRIQYKPREGMWRANFQENIFVNNPYPNPGQHISQIKNVHIDILN